MYFSDVPVSEYFRSDGSTYAEHKTVLWMVDATKLDVAEVILFDGSPIESIYHYKNDDHISVRFGKEPKGERRVDEFIPKKENLELNLARVIKAEITYEIIESI